jgi:hypothetical protein
MTAEQQACEQHFIANTVQQPEGRFVVRLPKKSIPSNLDLLASLQSEGYTPQNAGLNDIQTSRCNTTIS